MSTACPTSPSNLVTPARAAAPGPATKWVAPAGSWRYHSRRTSRVRITVAIALAASIHGMALLGFNQPHKKVAPKKVEEDVIAVQLIIPKLDDLEEPEPTTDEPAQTDPGMIVPMLADIPAPIMPNSFVQPIDIKSLVQPADFSEARTITIPGHINRGGKIGAGLGNIFNLADLDRIPEARVQPAPVFPVSLKREVSDATVRVEFIVTTDGNVINAVVVASTHRGFDEAAMTGVEKWKFRPGMKAGKKVNVRMQVPIMFRVVSGEEG